jgi:hypothetical protein
MNLFTQILQDEISKDDEVMLRDAAKQLLLQAAKGESWAIQELCKQELKIKVMDNSHVHSLPLPYDDWKEIKISTRKNDSHS